MKMNSNLLHISGLLLLVVVTVHALVVGIPQDKLAKFRTEITVLTAFGVPQVERKSAIAFALLEGSYKLKVGMKGFAGLTKVIEITENSQKIMICLEFGRMGDKRANGVTVVIKGASSDCNTLLVMPLHCVQTRPAAVYTILGGQRSFDNLEQGSYLFTLLAGERTCLTNRVDVRDFGPGTILELRAP